MIVTREEIKNFIEANSLKLKDIASFTGIHPTNLSRMVNAYGNIRTKDILAINAFFTEFKKTKIPAFSNIVIRDTSMMPTIQDGYNLRVEKASISSTKPNLVYAVILKSNQMVVGRLRVRGESISLIPDNPEFDIIKISKDEIKDILRVTQAYINL